MSCESGFAGRMVSGSGVYPGRGLAWQRGEGVPDFGGGFLPGGAGYLDAHDRRKCLRRLPNPGNAEVNTP